MSSHPDDLVQTLAHHDAAINTLGGRMTGVERGMATLQTEVHSGFNALNATLNGFNSKIEQISSRPQLDIHRTVSTVTTLAVLFSMVVAGIIWITTSQYAGMIAEQKGFNAATTGRIDDLKTRVDWFSRTEAQKTK
jgi:hypothetical protein